MTAIDDLTAANGVHVVIEAVKAPLIDPPRNLSPAEPQRYQLSMRDDPELAVSRPCKLTLTPMVLCVTTT
jgi:hypothetical protein